jgi:hypothetical protein
MVVGNEQIAAALDQPEHGIVHIERDQPALDGAKRGAQIADPGRKKRKGQGVRHGKLDHVLGASHVATQHGAGVLQALEHLKCLRVQGLAGRGQTRGIGAAIDQVGAGPGFERLDAPRKRRLRDMAQLGRAAKASGLGQADEIFEPFGFHGRKL